MHVSGGTLIEWFEVPPDDDDAFLAAWRHERPVDATLFRALRADAGPRFVSVAAATSREVYEVVHDDGAVDGAGGVVLIEPLAGGDEILSGWQTLRNYFAMRRGYLGTRLYRRPATDPRVIQLTRWSSPLMVFRAVREPAFEALAARIAFPSRPALYQRLPE